MSKRSDFIVKVLLFSFFSKLNLSNGVKKNILTYHPLQGKANLYPLSPDDLETNESIWVFSHAESPVYDPECRTLYWVDVLTQDIHAMNYVTFEHRVKHIAYGEVNIVIPIANSSNLLVGSKTELFLLDWDRPGDSGLKLIANLDPLKQGNVLNEGKADVLGRFWGGTKGPQQGDHVEPDLGVLYSLERPCYTPTVQLKPVTISNGLVWSLNNTVLYYIDSATNKIEAFDYDPYKGQISRRRTVLDLTEWGFPNACPDGMTKDRDGLLWVALHVNGSVIRIDPEIRQIVAVHQLPVCRTTSLTWAGESLEDLVVTTSKRNVLKRYINTSPLSGSIFILRSLGTGGVPDHKFVFSLD